MDNTSGMDSMNEHEGFFFLQLSEDMCDDTINYYEEYSKLYVSNILMRKKVEELREERNQLKEKLENKGHSNHKEKRMRRKAEEIRRHYLCDLCEKTYGSEASLKYHIRAKHQYDN